MNATLTHTPCMNAVETEMAEREHLMTLRVVKKYMEGHHDHPGFLLPWEEERTGRNGRRYFVDLVTKEITWKDPKGVIIRLNQDVGLKTEDEAYDEGAGDIGQRGALVDHNGFPVRAHIGA